MHPTWLRCTKRRSVPLRVEARWCITLGLTSATKVNLHFPRTHHFSAYHFSHFFSFPGTPIQGQSWCEKSRNQASRVLQQTPHLVADFYMNEDEGTCMNQERLFRGRCQEIVGGRRRQGKAGESWGEPRLCVSRIQTQLLGRRGSSKQAHQLISPTPSFSPILHYILPHFPPSTNIHLPFCSMSWPPYTYQISSGEQHTKGVPPITDQEDTSF